MGDKCRPSLAKVMHYRKCGKSMMFLDEPIVRGTEYISMKEEHAVDNESMNTESECVQAKPLHRCGKSLDVPQ